MAARAYEFDVAVIGGGSAGYAAARTASALGARVAVIEGGKEVGGLCILRGCMPSKAFLESAHRWHEIRRAGEFGLRAESEGVDMPAVQARKKHLIADFASYRREQLEDGKFTFIRGRASFQGPHAVFVDDNGRKKTITAATFILSTGSAVRCVDVPGLEEVGYATSDDALMTEKIPGSLAVLGGGIVAVELGQFFARMGTKTTLLQRSKHIARTYDEDVSAELERAFAAEGIDVRTGTKLLRVERAGKLKKIVYEQDGATHELEVEEILCAMGRDPLLDGLGLDRAGVEIKGSCLKLSDTLATTAPHIFAAGDVVGMHEVVHIAIQQGEIVARNAVRLVRKSSEPQEKPDYRLKALVTFTDPEIALVGLTETEAKEQGIEYLTASYPFADHGKAQIAGELFGFVKLIAEKTRGEIIGAQIIGPHASDLIHEQIAVMRYRGTASELAAMPHYHPTLAEIVTYPAEEIVEKLAESSRRKLSPKP
jgi:pyruvate/2-oxoglutarate dehydrogenase complex dihydrolipoamide dehydrogenase (E3) component